MRKYLPDMLPKSLQAGLPIVLPTVAVFLFFFLVFSSVQRSSAAIATHIVISEVQIEGATSTDEFVELYNPTNSVINLNDWHLTRKTAAVDTEEQIVATLSGNINPKGFFLIAHNGYDGTTPEDATYSTDFNITDNNTVILKNGGGQVIDLLGMGTASQNETATVLNPIDNRSVERKANADSTPTSMAPGGDDELNGNGEDTDSNSTDFVRHTSPTLSSPQNSSSSVEPVTASPAPSTEPTPTEIITPTPTDSEDPTPTVTQEPSPTDTIAPTATVTPTVITPTPTERPTIVFPQLQIVCTPKIISFKIFGATYNFEFPSCKVVRVN